MGCIPRGPAGWRLPPTLPVSRFTCQLFCDFFRLYFLLGFYWRHNHPGSCRHFKLFSQEVFFFFFFCRLCRKCHQCWNDFVTHQCRRAFLLTSAGKRLFVITAEERKPSLKKQLPQHKGQSFQSEFQHAVHLVSPGVQDTVLHVRITAAYSHNCPELARRSCKKTIAFLFRVLSANYCLKVK